MSRRRWESILARAAEIVASYDTSVTLRQLFYRLVAEHLLPNEHGAYQQLSRKTAEGRRAGTFPELVDRGRAIHRPPSFASPEEALAWLVRRFMEPRLLIATGYRENR